MIPGFGRSEVVIIYPFSRNREVTALRVRLCQSPPRLGGMFLLPCRHAADPKKRGWIGFARQFLMSFIFFLVFIARTFQSPFISVCSSLYSLSGMTHSKAGSSEIAWPLWSWRKGCNTPNTQSWCGKTGLCAKPLVNIEAPWTNIDLTNFLS